MTVLKFYRLVPSITGRDRQRRPRPHRVVVDLCGPSRRASAHWKRRCRDPGAISHPRPAPPLPELTMQLPPSDDGAHERTALRTDSSGSSSTQGGRFLHHLSGSEILAAVKGLKRNLSRLPRQSSAEPQRLRRAPPRGTGACRGPCRRGCRRRGWPRGRRERATAAACATGTAARRRARVGSWRLGPRRPQQPILFLPQLPLLHGGRASVILSFWDADTGETRKQSSTRELCFATT